MNSPNQDSARLPELANTVPDAMRSLAGIGVADIGTAPRETVWQDGKVRLLHFLSAKTAVVQTPVLISYALVNRWHMMDLQPDRSFIRKLLEQGADVYLIDWGNATITERYKTLADHICGNLNDCVEFVRKKHRLDRVNLMGVCQGGTFSVIYAALFPKKIKNLITLVTPVDFDRGDGLLFRWAKDTDVDAIVDGFDGIVPGEFLNTGFDMLKPMSKIRKYLALPALLTDPNALLHFLRMEQWVSDSPAQAGETYRQFIKDLYQQNKLVKGTLEIGGRTVSLKKITAPVLTVFAKDDHIVPPATTTPLNDHIGSTDKQLLEFPGGHIGVFVGSRSQNVLAPAIAKWLAARDS